MNTRLLLALAAILITNSHLEKFYPTPLLAGDGLLGNSIFFMVAGLGITLSAKKQLRSFPDYYWRRIIRIYPIVVAAVTIFFLIPATGWRTWSWLQFLQNYFWPTPWAFIEFVMILYVPFYFLLLRPSARVFLSLFAAAYLLFAIAWYLHPQPSPRLSLGTLDLSIYWVYWFQMMLLGGYVATTQRFKSSLSIILISLVAGSAVYVATKALFVTGRLAHGHYLLFLIVPVLCYGAAELAANKTLDTSITQRPKFAAAIEWIGDHTLEIYVLQGFLAYRDDLATLLPCPLNIVLFCALLAALAGLLHWLVSYIVPERSTRPAIA